MLPFKGKIKVTSGFRTPQRPNHGGIDLVGIESKEILSVTDGIVTIAAMQTGKSASYGNLVVVNYGGNRYYYAHMSKIDVKLGDKIKAGDKLGIMGATGNTTGVHLHFEVRNSKNVRIDPTSFIPPIKNEKGIYMGDTAPKKQESVVSNTVYIVKKGDTLSAIAKKFSTTWKELALINGIKNPNLIYAGQKIKLSSMAQTATAQYYPACKYFGQSIADALKSIGVDGSYAHRAKIAAANGITAYRGTAEQNLKMLNLLKSGKLKKTDRK